MTKTYIQSKAVTQFDSSAATTALPAFDSTTGAGNSIYVLVTGTYTGGTGWDISGITDTAGNSYAKVVDTGTDQASGKQRGSIWAAHNIAEQASNVVTLTHASTSAHHVVAAACEVSAGGTQSTDQTGSDTDAYNDLTITATCSGANTDAAAIVIGLGACYNGANAPTISLPTGHTSIYSYVPGAGTYRPAFRASYKILTGSETSSATWDTGATNDLSLIAAIATFKEAASTVKKLKLLAHSSAASQSSIEGVVLNAARDTVIGEFSGQSFDGTLVSGEAQLLITATDISPNGSTLTTSDKPLAIAYNATYTTPLVECTVVEV